MKTSKTETPLRLLKRAKSLDNYLSTVRLIREECFIPPHQELWFRAEDEAHSRTHLQPGLYRPREDGRSKSIRELLLLEGDLYDEFTRCASQLGDLSFNDDEWDPYFLMQHHGVPTRLLDWTDGALIALHFAVRNKPLPVKCGALVHVLDPWWLLDLLKRHPDRTNAITRWTKFNKLHPHDTYQDDWERLYLPLDEDDTKDSLIATPATPLLWDSPHVSRRVATACELPSRVRASRRIMLLWNRSTGPFGQNAWMPTGLLP